MLHPLTTQIVGSYTKPHWLARHSKLGAYDGSWWRPEAEVLQAAREDAARLAIYEQERAGLDLVTDGEAQRAAYDRHFLTALDGISFDKLEHVSLEDEVKTRTRRETEFSALAKLGPAIVDEIRWARSASLGELRFLKRHAIRPVKMTVVGPLTLYSRLADRFYRDEEAAVMALAAALNQELKALEREGVDVLQVDEPMFHMRLSLARRLGVAAISSLVDGLKTPVVVHACYGYAIAFTEKRANPAYHEAIELLAVCPIAGISLEYEQPAHESDLLRFCGNKHVVVGLLNLGTPAVETPQHIASRLRDALRVVPAERLHPSSDCGMWFLPRDVAFAKISALVRATELVRRESGLVGMEAEAPVTIRTRHSA
jgi:5-methyltetrahydropteroyltriglutamate--homocysteine methyltransferase